MMALASEFFLQVLKNGGDVSLALEVLPTFRMCGWLRLETIGIRLVNQS